MIVSINLFKSHWYSWEYLSNGHASGTLAKTNGNAKSYCLNVGTYDYLGESYHRVTSGAKLHRLYKSGGALRLLSSKVTGWRMAVPIVAVIVTAACGWSPNQPHAASSITASPVGAGESLALKPYSAPSNEVPVVLHDRIVLKPAQFAWRVNGASAEPPRRRTRT